MSSDKPLLNKEPSSPLDLITDINQDNLKILSEEIEKGLLLLEQKEEQTHNKFKTPKENKDSHYNKICDDYEGDFNIEIGAGGISNRIFLTWVHKLEKDLTKNDGIVKFGSFYNLAHSERYLREEINNLESF